MKRNSYRIEYRIEFYGKVHISGSTNDTELNDFSFLLHHSTPIIDFVDNYLGKKYFSQYAEGITIFSVPKRTYKIIKNYPNTFTEEIRATLLTN